MRGGYIPMQTVNDSINFLHINASDIKWGASIAGFRMHQALLHEGHGSHLLCGLKLHPGSDTSAIMPGRFSYAPNLLTGKLFNAAGLQSFGYPSSFFLSRSPFIRTWADVIILRNLHWWYISIGILPFLAEQAPLIWRVPDMWAITGHCVYSYECARWQTGCGNCPRLSDYPKLFLDTTHLLWKRKARIYAHVKGRLVFVSPSLWLKRFIEASPLTRDFSCEHIPTAVDLEIFKPGLRQQARDNFGIAADEKVIMLSSFDLGDKRKGIPYCVEAINALAGSLKRPPTVFLLGASAAHSPFAQGLKVVATGLLQDDRLIAASYNVADVFLNMSTADNLPNTLVEAAACGIPVVSRNAGGCAETFQEGRSGFAVEDVRQAAAALKNLLTDEARQKSFSAAARDFARQHFSMQAQVKAYVALASRLIAERRYAVQIQCAAQTGCSRYIAGIRIDATTYAQATERITRLSQERRGGFICVGNTHIAVEAYRSDRFRSIINAADIVTSDGMPLVWSLKLFGVKDAQRVVGYGLMLSVLARAEALGIAVGFYGGKDAIRRLMVRKLKRQFPLLKVAYSYSPPFRPLSPQEDENIVKDIVASGARILFIGLGCPKQEFWADQHRQRLPCVMITVGAAFDYLAGTIKRAPRLIQNLGLEWFVRLMQNPRRLFPRYLVANPVFIYLVLNQLMSERLKKRKRSVCL